MALVTLLCTSEIFSRRCSLFIWLPPNCSSPPESVVGAVTQVP